MNNKLKHIIPEYKPKAPLLVYASEQIKNVMEQATRVAKDTGCMVATILGDSGVMKTEIARWIAHQDPRGGKVVEINCGVLTETLIESELYGRKKGAHSDASETRIGLVAGAHGGVCIFDDIDKIPFNRQNKLACFIEDGIFKQVGCNFFRKADVKRIATTNADWKTAVSNGVLTKDLYNRLNNFRIHIPPLRDRKEDILILADHFLKQKTKAIGRTTIRLSAKVKDLFMRYHWPGNVRELKHTVEGGIIRCNKNTIFLEHLPEEFSEGFEAENQSNPTQDNYQKILLLLGELLSTNDRSTCNNISTPSPDLDSKLKEFISYIISRDDPIIYRRDYVNYKGTSKASGNRFFKKMVESGVLHQKGHGRGTYYTISPKKILELANRYGLTL